MPNIFFIGLYRFFFYSDERNEPAHVHIEDGSKAAKFLLHNAELIRACGCKGYELPALHKLVNETLRSA